MASRINGGSKILIFLVLSIACPAGAQTTISLRTQGRDMDFTNAVSTKPFKTGTTPPVSCATGDTFLNTSAPAGQNIYVCTAPGNPGTWSVEGTGGGAATSMSQLSDFGVSATGGTASVNCPSGKCQVRIGESVYTFSASATASTLTGTAGSTTVFFFVDSSGNMDFGYDGLIVAGATLSGLNGMIGTTSYPPNSVPLAHCAVSGNQFGACTDDRAMFSETVIDPGSGILVVQNPQNGHTTLSVSPATVPVLGGSNTYTGAFNDFSASQVRVTTGMGAPPASTCTGASSVGLLYVRADAGALNSSFYGCDKISSNTWGWELLQYSSASLPAGVAVTGGSNAFTGTQDFSGAQIRVTTGTGVPPLSTCSVAANVGYLYVRSDAGVPNASVYACDLTAPGTYAWELIQGTSGSGGSGGAGGQSSGNLSMLGPYLTDGSNYWITATGQQATLFNAAGFAFRQGRATASTMNNVEYVTFPAGSSASDNYETATSRTTLIATLNINNPSNTSGNNGQVGIALRNGSSAVECGVDIWGSNQPTGFRPYMNQLSSAYGYLGTVGATGTTLAGNLVTLKLSYAAAVTTCYLSSDGGATYVQIASQNGAATGYLNSTPTAASLNITAGGYGASVGVLSWVLQ